MDAFLFQTDNKGCFSEVVKTKLFQLRRTNYESKLTATAKITEDGTGKRRQQRKIIDRKKKAN